MSDYFILLRPQQYIKNLFIFLPAFFGLKLLERGFFINTIFVFIAFSLVASAVYIFNDIIDREDDRKHPVKKKRPIASGKVSVHEAVFMAVVLVIGGAALGVMININVFYLIALYVVLNILYTLKLKHVPILDVSVISVGFVIRLFVGAEVVNVSLSVWIVLVTFFLALFLAIAKRRGDILLYLSDGIKTRRVVDGYNIKFLDISIAVIASVTIVLYIMYTVFSGVAGGAYNDISYLTSIFVLLGILRYMQLLFVDNKGDSPTKVLLKDRFIQFTLLAWFATFWLLLY